MDIETETPKRKNSKKREKVTEQKCYEWLALAYYETLRFGFCNPLSWEQQAGKKVLPTVALQNGFIVEGETKRHRVWFNMDIHPTTEMAAILLDKYTAYRVEHGLAAQAIRRKAEKQEKEALVAEAPEQGEIELEPSSEPSLDTKQLTVAIMSLRVEVLALNEGQKHIQSVLNRVQTDLQTFMADVMGKPDMKPPVGGNAEDRPEGDPF